MSFRSDVVGEVPKSTAHVGKAVFPNGSLAIRIRDELGRLFADDQFADLFPRRGCPGLPPARLALVLEFVEGLSDRLAADAVRARIDWKYALNLDLSDPGFDYSVLLPPAAEAVGVFSPRRPPPRLRGVVVAAAALGGWLAFETRDDAASRACRSHP